MENSLHDEEHMHILHKFTVKCPLERPWCDFIVFTILGSNVEQIKYESHYWEPTVLTKLISFYDNCVTPEIVSPIHAIGFPICDL